MKIEVRSRGIEASGALHEHVVRRIHFQLDRFAREVSAIAVRIDDVNGTKGGVDKRCHVAVRGPALTSVMIEDLSTDAYAAVDVAVARAARAVSRELARSRAVRRDGSIRRVS